jgi:hypothetical protein
MSTTSVGALDGRRLIVAAPCCELHVEIHAPHRVTVAHDDGCPALDPNHPRHLELRTQADILVALALRPYLGPSTVVIA